ncbi:MAG: NAD(P)/FAD-dependent oxidoreductase [Desulfobacterales bacterium]|nr:NAD(P)/FAD-dependent oxidoreductase [Desulfobacterales bacterium]
MNLKGISRRSFLTLAAMSTATMALNWKNIEAFAAKMGPKKEYPTMIIGAGLGGLCCGAYLAREGVPVTIVEQHDIPGGYATAFDRAGGKYRFEVSLHGTSVRDNRIERILKNIGVFDKLEWVALPEVYRLITPQIDISVPQRDPQAYIQLLSQHFPDEAQGIRQFVQAMIALHEEVEDFSNKKSFFKPLFPLQYRRMWKVRNQTLADLLNAHVKNPELQGVLAALWGYYGLPPSKLSGFYYANATGGYLKNGSYSIKTRSQSLSNAMADAIENAGGQIIYGTAADKINVSDGRVQSVILSDGRRLPARAVVSNASALTTFQQLLPPKTLPHDYLKKLQAYQPSISSFIVWLGLNQPLRGKINGFSSHISTAKGPEKNYEYCMAGAIDKGPFSVSIYDNLYEGYSSPGTTSVMLLFLCGYEPWRQFEADYHAGNKKAYYAEKRRWAAQLIQRAEKHMIPDLTSMIEVQEAATPLTNWRYTGNSEGAIYGFEQSMDNAFMNRIKNRTPIKGLYLASAWGNPGGGYGGVLRGGELTFQKMMQDWGRDSS